MQDQRNLIRKNLTPLDPRRSSESFGTYQKSRNLWPESDVLIILAVVIFAGLAGFMMPRQDDSAVHATMSTSEMITSSASKMITRTASGIFKESLRYILGFRIVQFFGMVLSVLGLSKAVSLFSMKWRRSEAFMNQVSFAIFDICVAILLYLVMNLVPSLLTNQGHTQMIIQSSFFLFELAVACFCIGRIVRIFKRSRMLRIRELAVYLNVAIAFALPIILDFLDFHTAAMTLFGGSATIIITVLMYPESDSSLPI